MTSEHAAHEAWWTASLLAFLATDAGEATASAKSAKRRGDIDSVDDLRAGVCFQGSRVFFTLGTVALFTLLDAAAAKALRRGRRDRPRGYHGGGGDLVVARSSAKLVRRDPAAW